MAGGFVIRCLDCGREKRLEEGRRAYRNEEITFGTDNYGADQIACECGNALEEKSGFVNGDFEREFIVEWRSVAKPRT